MFMLIIQGYPGTLQRRIAIGIAIPAVFLSSFSPLLFLIYGQQQLNCLEWAFFEFAHHWEIITILTLALAAWVQWFAAKRVRQMELL
jgi:hypothetical protein